MRRAWLALVLGACVSCSETQQTTHGSGGAAGDVGDVAGAPAKSGGASGGSQGQGGSKVSGGGGAGGALVVGGETGVEGGSDAGGAAETGDGGAGPQGGAGAGNQDCNELELIEMTPACTPLGAPMPEQGGTVVEGTYAMVAYQLAVCIGGLEQTLRVEQTAPNTYNVETLANLGNTRANSTFVRQGVAFSSTSTCGAEEVDEPYGYTAYEDQGVPHLRLANQGTFTYRRVSE